MYFVGIDSSCDDTCLAFFKDTKFILVFNKIYKQVYLHKKFDGVVPNIALAEHYNGLSLLCKKYKFFFFKVFNVAFTNYPGFTGSLFIGITFSRLFSFFFNTLSIKINHLEGHLLSIFLSLKFFTYPFIAFLISGGHTFLVYVRDYGSYHILGSTLDDSAGEFFDKFSSFLGCGYPGGLQIENFSYLASHLNLVDYKFFYFFYHILINFNFSFSGLKTQIKIFFKNIVNFSICYFKFSSLIQNKIFDFFLNKVFLCLKYTTIKNLIIVGGCASNFFLCKKFSFFLRFYNISLYVPQINFCTDNAAMISIVGFFLFIRKKNLYKTNKILNIFNRSILF